MEIITWAFIFVIALAALLKSADLFTDSAERIGLHFKIPPFIIGVTIIALGTSLPELLTSVISTLEGAPEIVAGDVVGSNIANILLVIGATAVVGKKLIVDKNILAVDLPFVFGSAVFLYLLTLDGKFTFLEGLLGLFMLTSYLAYNALSHRKLTKESAKEHTKFKSKVRSEGKDHKLGFKAPAILLLSGIGLYFAADWTVQSIINLATLLGVGAELIAISAVAIGTSLPELIVSLSAAIKGKADIAIGNVTGSNIFNILGVMSVSSFFGDLTIPPTIVAVTIPAMLLITILYILISMDREVTQWEGYALLLTYVAFLGVTFGLF